jgi:hypothetical protein
MNAKFLLALSSLALISCAQKPIQLTEVKYDDAKFAYVPFDYIGAKADGRLPAQSGGSALVKFVEGLGEGGTEKTLQWVNGPGKKSLGLSRNVTKIEELSSRVDDLSKLLEHKNEENKGLIPYSYDGFDDKKNVLKSTYFYQFESYFEISTDSYFFKDIKNISDFSPITEKIVKHILSFIPFIMFGSPRLKYNLEQIGLSFNCPLYGFYDNTSEASIAEGLKHVEIMITKSKEDLHKIYFEYFNEFTKNNETFLKHFSDLRRAYKNNILNTTII